MAELVDHPFLSGPKTNPEGDTPLTVLNYEAFNEDQFIIDPNFVKGPARANKDSVQFELTTQTTVQTQILKQYLTDPKYTQPVPRYEKEDFKGLGAEELEVEPVVMGQPNMDELLLVQRQYSGSVYDKNAEELEFD